MALTNKGSKWENKNSLYLLFGFIPVLNCLAFFHMSSRVKNKKWSMLGWIVLIVNIVMIVITILATVVTNPNPMPRYYNVEESPKIVDYLNSEQKRLYYEDSSYEFSTEFKLTEEYSNYEKAYDQWLKAGKEWEKQPEIAEQIEAHESFDSIQTGIIIGFPAVLGVIDLIFFIMLIVDRPKYLKLLEQSENKNSIANRINSVTKSIVQNTNDNKKEEVQSNNSKQIDINSANEDELSSLQGLTIVDAKKAISYRDEHNGFNNMDEFFDCINAKPHIIVALEKQLIVGEYKAVKPSKTDNSGKRMLDL